MAPVLSPDLGASCPAAGTDATCYHCGLPNPRRAWRGAVAGVDRAFCCAGCLAIAQTIAGAGLDAFYRDRLAADPADGAGPARFDPQDAGRFDTVAEQAGLLRRLGPGRADATLLIDGMTCGACGWLLERWLQDQPGVHDAQVNYAMRRCRVTIDPERIAVSGLIAAVARIGYRAHPYDPARREALDRATWRRLLLRAGIALLAMMQVMMLALPAYLSDDGVAPADARLLDWAAFTLTLPVMLYCATPLFAGAWRGLRTRTLGMDVPVALALAAAFVASALATARGAGTTYYDSITMFVALLLVARVVELAARQRAGAALERTAASTPMTAERLARWPRDAAAETVAASTLAAGDVVQVRPGAVMPADGVVVDGRSQLSEAWLTGESRARPCGQGDGVLAGAQNGDGALVVRVTAAGDATRLAGVARLVEQAAGARPSAVRLADRAARHFVAALLVFAAATALAWWWIDPSRALAVTVAVLVVSCPCALSLATPAVIAAGTAALARRQVVVVGPDALETLARVDVVAFDKTGTLTHGTPTIVDHVSLRGTPRDDALRIAAALEQASEHPLARALRSGSVRVPPARDVTMHPGEGIEGDVDGMRWRIGAPSFVTERTGADAGVADAIASLPTGRTVVALGNDHGVVAIFGCADAARPGARACVAALHAARVGTVMLSGDRASAAGALAASLGIDDVRAGLAPADKCRAIGALQRDRRRVAMIGDGVNDAAALAQADVAISLGSATPLAQCSSDIVLLGERLADVPRAIRHARKVGRIIAQNLAWAAAYNAVALPAAAAGLVTPLLASIGMSVSSLVVVLNAVRAARLAPDPLADAPAAEPWPDAVPRPA